jgi:hypothetical protein
MISLVILSVIAAIFTNGLTAAAFSLLAFSLLFYVASTQQSNKPPRE